MAAARLGLRAWGSSPERSWLCGGIGELCTPQSPPLHPRYRGATLSSGTFCHCTPRGDREMGTLCGHPREGRTEGWGHPTLATRMEHMQGGMDRGMCTPQRDRRMRNVLGMWVHMGVSPLGEQRGGRRHSWVTPRDRMVTPQRQNGDIPLGISGD